MGFSGQLNSVNLADIFQTLHMNRQTGTLTVTSAGVSVLVYFEQGQVALCSAPPIEGRPYLLSILAKKGALQPDDADELTRRQRASGQNLRELVKASGLVDEPALDEICAWCIEEQVCPVFEWTDGDFTFADGAPSADLGAGDIIETGPGRLPTTHLVMEATRRGDEWKRIREIIPDFEALYEVDNDGRANLRNLQTDQDMLKVLRYLDGRHTIDSIAQTVGVTRFDAFAIVAQLISNGVARARSASEIVADAEQLRAAGEPAVAKILLENALRQAQLPEVLRPLAEICAEMQEVPRAVELYLILIQSSQDQGDLDQALKDLDTVLALSPDDPELIFDRAQVQAELGQAEAAAAGFVAAAQAYLARKDVGKAVDACHRAKNLLPRSPEPHRYLAKAYLLDGHSENAVVEYKSLWHALLTTQRPKRALEALREILDGDCKYQGVKDQVLQHAQNSEVVKTGKAVRVLVYATTVAVVIAAGIAGWLFYENKVLHERGSKEINDFAAAATPLRERLEHPALLNGVERLRKEYGAKFSDLNEALNAQEAAIRADFERRAQARLEEAEALHQGGQYVKAFTLLDELKVKYRGTAAAGQADAARTRIQTTQIGTEVVAVAAEAKRRWDAWDWDGACQRLQPLLARPDLPPEIRQELAALDVDWKAAQTSARRLGERAAALERAGDLKGALTGWRRATKGEGDSDAGNARLRLLALEKSVAISLASAARESALRRDDRATFARVDELAVLARESSGEAVKEILANLELPFVIELDSHHAQLLVARAGQPARTVRAPAGAKGPWKHELAWKLGETVTVTASRAGFLDQTITISAQGRRSATTVPLARGPRWRKDLGGLVTAPPTVIGQEVFLGTNRATLEAVDPAQNTIRTIAFPDTVAEFAGAPVVWQGRAFVVLDDHIHALDLATRGRLWSWPNGKARMRLNGMLHVQEHDLIQGQVMVMAGTLKQGLAILALEPAGTLAAYPGIPLDADLTAVPFVDHGNAEKPVLMLATGQLLRAFDASESTERTAPSPLWQLRARGDLTGRLVPAEVAGQKAVLVSDSSGLVVAISPAPSLPEQRRIAASWPLEGQNPSHPVVGGNAAFVTLPEGKVAALSLENPGTLLWRAPAKGVLGPIVGAPALGLRGLYVATANGVLHCLDPQSGAERWRCDLGSGAAAAPATVGGRLLVALRNGQLLCFEEGED